MRRIGFVWLLCLGGLALSAPPAQAQGEERPPCYACQTDTETYGLYCIDSALRGRTEGCLFSRNTGGGWRCEAKGDVCAIWSTLLPAQLSPDGTVLASSETPSDGMLRAPGAPAAGGVSTWSRQCGGVIVGRAYAPQVARQMRDESSRIRV